MNSLKHIGLTVYPRKVKRQQTGPDWRSLCNQNLAANVTSRNMKTGRKVCIARRWDPVSPGNWSTWLTTTPPKQGYAGAATRLWQNSSPFIRVRMVVFSLTRASTPSCNHMALPAPHVMFANGTILAHRDVELERKPESWQQIPRMTGLQLSLNIHNQNSARVAINLPRTTTGSMVN